MFAVSTRIYFIVCPQLLTHTIVAIILNNVKKFLERARGIEPLSSDWKSVIIPLYYARFGKGEENRTPASGFGDQRDTISLHPHKKAPCISTEGHV